MPVGKHKDGAPFDNYRWKGEYEPERTAKDCRDSFDHD
jgi:hypothetical protein